MQEQKMRTTTGNRDPPPLFLWLLFTPDNPFFDAITYPATTENFNKNKKCQELQWKIWQVARVEDKIFQKQKENEGASTSGNWESNPNKVVPYK